MVEVVGDVASKLELEDWLVEVEAAVEGAEKVADVLGWDGDPELVDVSVQHIKYKMEVSFENGWSNLGINDLHNKRNEQTPNKPRT